MMEDASFTKPRNSPGTAVGQYDPTMMSNAFMRHVTLSGFREEPRRIPPALDHDLTKPPVSVKVN